MNGKCIVSDLAKNIFHHETALLFSKTDIDAGNGNLIRLFPHHPLQQISGFGGSFTEASGVVYNNMSQKAKTDLLDLYFSKAGNNYNLARLPIQSCDFSLGNYSYINTLEDLNSGKMDFTRDHKNIIPFITAATRVNRDLVLMASPWSPPAFMKTNNDMNRGGRLKTEYYSAWAEVIVRFLQEYSDQGIRITKISIQNEPVAIKPWESCLYTVEQEADFAIHYLKTALAAQGFGAVNIFIWDHDKDGLVDWADRAFANEEGQALIDGIAFHWYSGDHFAQVQYVSRRYPDKELLFTEGCVPQEGEDDVTQLKHGGAYLHDMIGNFNSGATGYIDWNLLLDNLGGPNHMGNLCEAPIQYDADRDRLRINLSYYYIGHFSRFVKAGARVILSSSFHHELESVAFLNPDGERVVVLFNNSPREMTFYVAENDNKCCVSLAANSVCTLILLA